MSEIGHHDADVVSMFDLGATLLRRRWFIARWMLACGVIAALLVVAKPRLFLASASFVPQGSDASRSSLSALVGSVGISMPVNNQSFSADFYARLLKSRELLTRITRDTFAIRDNKGDHRIAFADLFKIPKGPPRLREELSVNKLSGLINASVSKITGVVDVSIATKWPDVSLAIVSQLMAGVDDFNQHTRQGQGAAERKFVEARLLLAQSDLRTAEDRMQSFVSTNRQWQNSPDLVFQHERMQRDLVLKNQMVTALTQSYEDARLREVRDTPLTTVFETPKVDSQPQPRGRVKSVLLGLILGGFIGVFSSLGAVALARRRRDGNPATEDFFSAVHEMTGSIFSRKRNV